VIPGNEERPMNGSNPNDDVRGTTYNRSSAQRNISARQRRLSTPANVESESQADDVAQTTPPSADDTTESTIPRRSSELDDGPEETVEWTDLIAFERDLLEAMQAIAQDPETTSYGLAIKRELEDRYNEPINYSRLYPNLDRLVRKNLVEKSSLDRRTNRYELTDAAMAMLEERARSLAAAFNVQFAPRTTGESTS
jgi:DNA-binding PadR family transcriptional regulator